MKSLLITGALGHIGSKLIRSSKINKFKNIILLDNLVTKKYSSLFNLPKKNFIFIEDDICTANLNKYFKGIDVVIHLAALTDVAKSFIQKKQVEKVNYYGTKRVADACLVNKCRLIFPSTTSIYGIQHGLIDEKCLSGQLKPQSPYAENKLKAEKLLTDLGHRKKLKFVIFRFGTICGASEGMNFHTAVNKFCWQAITNKPLTIWQTAYYQKRPYLALEDAINAIIFFVKKNIFDQKIYNVVTENYTIEEIVKLIGKYYPFKITLVQSKAMNDYSYEVTSRLIEAKGFQFKASIEESIKGIISLLKNANCSR